MPLKISVAMATYNGAAYIREQLASICAQSVPPFEIVITDDCSTDDTVAIAAEFARSSPVPIHLHRNDANLGFANNFLRAVGLCSGDWIAFSDQDDVWYPHKLATVIETIEKASSDLIMVCHVVDVVDEKLVPTGQRLPRIPRARIAPRNSHNGFWHAGGCTIVFDATLLAEVDSNKRPPDDWLPTQPNFRGIPWLPHDKWISMLANALGEVAHLPEALGAYRRHEAAVSGDHSNIALSEKLRLASATGTAFYASLASTADLTAAALRDIASGLGDSRRRRDLGRTAAKFTELAIVQRRRADLYADPALPSRVGTLASLLLMRGYFGDRFYSLGPASLAKDLARALTGR